jgi:hypothetical protein
MLSGYELIDTENQVSSTPYFTSLSWAILEVIFKTLPNHKVCNLLNLMSLKLTTHGYDIVINILKLSLKACII